MASEQVERLHEAIRQKIIRAEYRPGMPLRETALAEEHGTSRTPVREVLARLKAEGLVDDHEDRRGYSVARITLQDLRDTYEVRRLLEGEAAARAAALAGSEEIDRLRELASYDFTVGDTDAYGEAMARNHEFHLQVVRCCHNELLIGMVVHCLTHMSRFWALGFGLRVLPEREPEISDRPMRESVAEHLQLVDAIEQSQEEAARRIIQQHIDRNRDLMVDRMMSGLSVDRIDLTPP